MTLKKKLEEEIRGSRATFVVRKRKWKRRKVQVGKHAVKFSCVEAQPALSKASRGEKVQIVHLRQLQKGQRLGGEGCRTAPGVGGCCGESFS